MLQLIIFSNISSFVCRHSTYKNHVLYLCVSLDFSFILHRHSLVGATGGGKCSSIFFSIKDIFWPLSWTGVNKKLIYFIKDHFGSVKVKKKKKGKLALCKKLKRVTADFVPSPSPQLRRNVTNQITPTFVLHFFRTFSAQTVHTACVGVNLKNIPITELNKYLRYGTSGTE